MTPLIPPGDAEADVSSCEEPPGEACFAFRALLHAAPHGAPQCAGCGAAVNLAQLAGEAPAVYAGAMYARDPAGVEFGRVAARADVNGKRVIEVGCGGGRLTRCLAESAQHVYAFDPNAESIEQAKQRWDPKGVAGSASRCTAPRRWMLRGDASISRCAAGRCDACQLRTS